MSRKDLMVKYNIKSKGYLSTILNLYRIKYFHECPDPTLSWGLKCTPIYRDDKSIEVKDKEPLR
jgi:hypothetical protein